MKTVSLGLVSVLSTGLGLFLLSTIQVSAQPLIMNSPTGSMTDGANISINPEEPLPANGTVSISTEGVADTDMNVIPPVGVTVVIENDTVTITNQAVDIETADGGERRWWQRRWWQRRWWQRRWWQRRWWQRRWWRAEMVAAEMVASGDGDTGEEDSPEEG